MGVYLLVLRTTYINITLGLIKLYDYGYESGRFYYFCLIHF